MLEGPDFILFGRGSTGGVIEQDSKMPPLEQFTDASVSGGTNDRPRATGDVNIPIDGSGHARRPARQCDGQHQRRGRTAMWCNIGRYGLAPSLALGLGTPTRLDVSYFHQTKMTRPISACPGISASRRRCRATIIMVTEATG